jgi:DNA-binding IclR family transcriptional regulator
MRSIGVVVRDHTGWPAAAIAVTWPVAGPGAGQIDGGAPQDPGALARLVAGAAAELERRIGRS